ncbi:glycoside hydrolase family 73 protein [Limosilactobacillus sp.]|uniref:glycoside hydrolase family 73 protein n=1 Tax=Limosilactobacillus sp. TaxID=2773925 RepID=UPI003F077C2C
MREPNEWRRIYLKKRRSIIIAAALGIILVVTLTLGAFEFNERPTTTHHRETHSSKITVKQFVKQVAPAAQQEQQKYHIPASITIAQAGIESNWGRSKLAYKYNNLFGIKANSKKNRVRMYTTENINGKNKEVKQYFQVYDSWSASIKSHTYLIVRGTADNHRRFRGVQKAKNYKQAAYELQKNGYATDPDYASKLIYAIQKFDLNKYDKY